MRKLLICSAIISCFINSFAHAQTYTSMHTLGKLPSFKTLGTGVLDLTEITKANPRLVFAVKDPQSGEISYTSNSIFYGKNDGYYYQGHKRLQGYPIATDIMSTDCKLTDIKSPPEEIPALATKTLVYAGNLDSTDMIAKSPFNPSDSTSYNFTTIAEIYDNLGNQHQLSIYYIKNSSINAWKTAIYVDDKIIGSGDLTFNSSAQLVSATGMDSLLFYPDDGASPQAISLNFSGLTQFATHYYMSAPESDGMPSGIYSTYMLDNNGYLSFNYSNGQSITFSKVAAFIQ